MSRASQVVENLEKLGQLSFYKGSRFSKCDQCCYMEDLKGQVSEGLTQLTAAINEAYALHNLWQLFEVRN